MQVLLQTTDKVCFLFFYSFSLVLYNITDIWFQYVQKLSINTFSCAFSWSV